MYEKLDNPAVPVAAIGIVVSFLMIYMLFSAIADEIREVKSAHETYMMMFDNHHMNGKPAHIMVTCHVPRFKCL